MRDDVFAKPTYGSTSRTKYASVGVLPDREQTVHYPFCATVLDTDQKVVIGDGGYVDNNGLAHMCGTLNSELDGACIVVFNILSTTDATRHEDVAKEQEYAIAQYCGASRSKTDVMPLPALFESLSCKPDKRIAKLLHIASDYRKCVVCVSVQDAVYNDARVRLIFVSFVIDVHMRMLPSTENPVGAHKDFATRLYTACTRMNLIRTLREQFRGKPVHVCVAGGGMKTFTCGLVGLEYMRECMPDVRSICGVSGGSWAMLYFVSHYANEYRGEKRVERLLDLVGQRWTQIVLRREPVVDESMERVARLCTILRGMTGAASRVPGVGSKIVHIFGGADMRSHLKAMGLYMADCVEVVAARFGCDWATFVREWLFEERDGLEAWRRATPEECPETADITLKCAAAIFEDGDVEEEQERSRIGAVVQQAKRSAMSTTERVTACLWRRPATALPALLCTTVAGGVLGAAAATCRYVYRNMRLFDPALPCVPLTLVYPPAGHATHATASHTVIFAKEHGERPLYLSEEMPVTTASACSSAACAAIASKSTLRHFLEGMGLTSYKVELTQMLAPAHYPRFLIPWQCATELPCELADACRMPSKKQKTGP